MTTNMTEGDGPSLKSRGEGLLLDRGARRLTNTAAQGRASSSLRWVNSQRAPLYERMGQRHVRDVIYALPGRLLDFTEVSTVLMADVGSTVTVVVTVDKVLLKRPKPRMTVVELECHDATGSIMASYFGQPWLADKFAAGQVVALSGKVSFSYGFKRMSSPYADVVDDPRDAVADQPGVRRATARVVPVHHVTEGLSAAWARRIAAEALAERADQCDFWPARLRARRGLMPLGLALRDAHFPQEMEHAQEARRRLAYDEATLLQLALRMSRDAHVPGAVTTCHVDGGAALSRLREAMPFGLTDDQAQAFAQIRADMASDRSMSRLLLGDVGTGKTAVATMCLGLVADTGSQAAIMSPTSVLAAQYATKVGPILDAAQISWALLTGATPPKERALITEKLGRGEITVLFGTHALLSEDVGFARLSLVVIDEQQRFGVRQRHALRDKGKGADLLIMTATPIPRTLALSLYGDLDCSYLTERPNPGAGYTTHVLSKRDRPRAYDAIREAISQGHQAYVVCPLIGSPEGSDSDGERHDIAAEALAAGEDPSDQKAAAVEAQVLQEKVFPQAKVGLLTGRMSADEKQDVMARFRARQIDVLVCTTVIEVGVDVPNATVMLIEDGERFGLAQLHQLRGRVGRGDWAGSVFIAASDNSKAAKQRLKALEQTSDGYELARMDLGLRREGEILGKRQSGDATLRYVDLTRDLDLLEWARDDAAQMLAEDPDLLGRAHAPVRDELMIRFGDMFREVSGG